MAKGVQKGRNPVQNKKIDSYFKPAPKRPLENNNRPSGNDENSKTSETPSSSKVQKRQFGDIKRGGLQAKSKQSLLRLPLRDINPRPLNNISNMPTPVSQKPKKSAPGFAVLCDDDIEKGVEKAPTPPMRDSQDSQANSQTISSQDINSQILSTFGKTPLNDTLNTQYIQENDDMNTQFTEMTSSPINVYKDDVPESQEFPIIFTQKDDEDDEHNLPDFDVMQPTEKHGKPAGKENQIDLIQGNSQTEDIIKLEQDSVIVESSPVKEVEGDDEADDDNDDDDDDEAGSDLFGKTVDRSLNYLIPKSNASTDCLSNENEEAPLTTSSTAVEFFDSENKQAPLTRSSTAVEYSDDDDDKADGSPFFDLSDNEVGPLDDDGFEFSINDLDVAPQDSSKEPLQSYTLSPDDTDSFSQILLPLPNPRGEGILEKLDLDDDDNNDTIEPFPSCSLSQDYAESLSQVLVPLPNPRGKDILEKLEIENNKDIIDSNSSKNQRDEFSTC